MSGFTSNVKGQQYYGIKNPIPDINLSMLKCTDSIEKSTLWYVLALALTKASFPFAFYHVGIPSTFTLWHIYLSIPSRLLFITQTFNHIVIIYRYIFGLCIPWYSWTTTTQPQCKEKSIIKWHTRVSTHLERKSTCLTTTTIKAYNCLIIHVYKNFSHTLMPPISLNVYSISDADNETRIGQIFHH